ncbi:hypothetical protein [Blastococcus brunescens]|uniref:Uncharacterized protein n=1 Tax=Blastococcus brunescens TaxID=1564165 RepID=A0ABZ1BAZ3_9ACTN|nr:hypothetical protein [Blastococcus sp. BMG 8361]WRL67328.1 hypothetical protein U6N30_32240 [Blastococcus sp. BMG 8361]
MTGRRRAVLIGLVGLVVLGVGGAACPPGAPRAIPSSEVPYGLAQSSPEATGPTTSAPAEAPSQVFLVAAGDVLVGRPREVEGARCASGWPTSSPPWRRVRRPRSSRTSCPPS